jgi:hypothetical protein
MKKLLCLLLVGVSFIGQAQKITQKSLQGNWTLVSLGNDEVILYPEERKGVLTELGREGLSEEEIREEEAGLAYEAAEYVDAFMTFSGNKILQTIDGEVVLSGTFEVSDKGDTLAIIPDEGEHVEARLSLKDGQLHLFIIDEQADYVFERTK